MMIITLNKLCGDAEDKNVSMLYKSFSQHNFDDIFFWEKYVTASFESFWKLLHTFFECL